MSSNINSFENKASESLQSWKFENCDPNLWLSVVQGYESCGVWTMPVKNKAALFRGYQRQDKGYSATSAEQTRMNLEGAQCALYMRQNSLAVIDLDSDDPDFLASALLAFGHTDVIVKTRRGYHLYYADSAGLQPRSGDNIDLKAGRAGYVVAPFTEITDEQRYEFCLSFTDLNEREALASFCHKIKSPDLLQIRMTQEGERFFNDRASIAPKTAPNAAQPKAKAQAGKAAHVTRKASQHVSNDNVIPFDRPVCKGERNNFLYKQSLFIAKQTGPEYNLILSRLSDQNEARCKPTYPGGKLEAIAKWAVKIEREGKNNFASSTASIEPRPVTLSPYEIESLLPHHKALRVYLQVKSLNMPDSRFPLTPEFVREVLEVSDKNRAIRASIKATLLDVGLIKLVRHSNGDNLCELFKFTDKAVLKGTSLKVIPNNGGPS